MVVTVAEVGTNDKLVLVVFTVANCCACCCTPPLFDLSDLIVIYALFKYISMKNKCVMAKKIIFKKIAYQFNAEN